jgi:hypothetical protein
MEDTRCFVWRNEEFIVSNVLLRLSVLLRSDSVLLLEWLGRISGQSMKD